MIIKKAQHQFVDVFDESIPGWEHGHTRVQIVKKPGQPTKAYYISGKRLPHIRYVEIAKSL